MQVRGTPTAALLALVLLVGCSDPVDTDEALPASTDGEAATEPTDDETTADPTTDASSGDAAEPSEATTDELDPRTGLLLGNAVDATDQVAQQVEGVVVTTARELAEAIALRLGGDSASGEVLEVAEGEPVRAVIVVTGFPDDSVSGQVVTVLLEPDDARGWTVVSASSRPICARGVSDGICV